MNPLETKYVSMCIVCSVVNAPVTSSGVTVFLRIKINFYKKDIRSPLAVFVETTIKWALVGALQH